MTRYADDNPQTDENDDEDELWLRVSASAASNRTPDSRDGRVVLACKGLFDHHRPT